MCLNSPSLNGSRLTSESDPRTYIYCRSHKTRKGRKRRKLHDCLSQATPYRADTCIRMPISTTHGNTGSCKSSSSSEATASCLSGEIYLHSFVEMGTPLLPHRAKIEHLHRAAKLECATRFAPNPLAKAIPRPVGKLHISVSYKLDTGRFIRISGN